jgi:hypothetical protein
MKNEFKELYLGNTLCSMIHYTRIFLWKLRIIEGNVILLPLKIMGSYSYRSFSEKNKKISLSESGKSWQAILIKSNVPPESDKTSA